METSNFIGNVKSREYHRPDCFTLKHLYNTNQRSFYSEEHAASQGFDPCGHCLPKHQKRSEVTGDKEYYYGHFYGVFSGLSTDDYSEIFVNYGTEITVYAKLQKAVFTDGIWTMNPISNHSIDIACDFIDFPTQKTNREGLASWKYTIPEDFEPGITDMFANPHVKENLVWHKGISALSFRVPQQITILENVPKDFDQETKIIFKLATQKIIKADIYRGSSENEFSHIKNLRDFGDGAMLASDQAHLTWDGTIDHGLRKGKAVMSGQYKIVIAGQNGVSDRDELSFKKKKGTLGGDDPESNQPTDYISDVHFSYNPFSAKTKVKINFHLEKSAKVSIHIQHIHWNFIGRCIKEIIRDEYLESGNHSYTWDGKNNENIPVTLGAYKVRILANETAYVEKPLWKKVNRFAKQK